MMNSVVGAGEGGMLALLTVMAFSSVAMPAAAIEIPNLTNWTLARAAPPPWGAGSATRQTALHTLRDAAVFELDWRSCRYLAFRRAI